MRRKGIAFGAWPSKLTTKAAIPLCLFFVVVVFLVQRNLLFDLGLRIFVRKKHLKITFWNLKKKTVVTFKPCRHISRNICIHIFFPNTVSRVHIFEYAANSDACGQSYQQIFEFANVALSDPVFKSTRRIDLAPWKTPSCNSLTKQRKSCQHTTLRIISKQSICQKHRALESVRIRVDRENDSKTIRIRYMWTRIFFNPKKMQIQKFPYTRLRGLKLLKMTKYRMNS